MPDTLPSHATILVHHVAPLSTSHARQHAHSIIAHGAQDAPSASEDLRWTIRNKYYTADVGFRLLELQEHGGEGEEPAVIVMAAREELPSQAVADLLKRYVARSVELEVALLVSLPLSTSASPLVPSQLDEEAWEDLAMEHGFEWVDLEPEVEQKLAEADEAREERGLRRVVGALQAHTWEGMIPVARDRNGRDEERPGRRLESGAGVLGLDSDEEELSALGAPPLPAPRAFVPTPMAFPETFLPSIKTSGKPAAVAVSSTSPVDIHSSPTEPPAFEDDFAPFVPALPSTHTSFPPLPLSTLSTSSSSPPISPLYRHPELAFPDSNQLPYPAAAGREEGEDDGEELEAMFAKLKGVREEALGLDMEARRALAERTVMGLFGGGLSDEENE